MEILSQVIFALLLAIAAFFFTKSVLRLRFNITLGQEISTVDHKSKRWRNVFFLAFGQRKMFKRPLLAFMHLIVYAGFLIVNLELLEIIVDGLFGTHRAFQEVLGKVYPVMINTFEFFAVAVFLVCIIFLWRRNVAKVARFQSAEMTKWPKLDGNLILIFEMILMFALLSMNTTDTLLVQEKTNQSFFFSDLLIPIYSGLSMESIHILERGFWWFHIIGICFFANYVMYSKHLHIFLAFPNTFYASLHPKGEMPNMPSVTNEVKIMMGMMADGTQDTPQVVTFGAKDVTDLSNLSLLSAYSCTECGRCTSRCPANLTGKKLSPRKIMMDTRDRAEELGDFKRRNGVDQHDGKALLKDYITDEELFACTSCNACVEECPLSINPLSIINELKRYKAMEEAQGPSEWNMMYQGLETSFNPWKFPPTDRMNWAEKINNVES